MRRYVLLREYLKLFFSILLCFSVGLFSSFFMSEESFAWYHSLNKPSWTPGDWVFTPVWTILYLMIAFSLWIVWTKKIPPYPTFRTYLSFFVQLFFNLLWPFAFFAHESTGLGLLDLFFLNAAIAVNLFTFSKVSPFASLLLAPYFVWTLFALALNFSLWMLNP